MHDVHRWIDTGSSNDSSDGSGSEVAPGPEQTKLLSAFQPIGGIDNEVDPSLNPVPGSAELRIAPANYAPGTTDGLVDGPNPRTSFPAAKVPTVRLPRRTTPPERPPGYTRSDSLLITTLISKVSAPRISVFPCRMAIRISRMARRFH
jgi:hypothetical protein